MNNPAAAENPKLNKGLSKLIFSFFWYHHPMPTEIVIIKRFKPIAFDSNIKKCIATSCYNIKTTFPNFVCIKLVTLKVGDKSFNYIF